MAHGYLGDGYGSHGDIDPDRDDDRERNWRGREDWRERGSMFGDWDRGRSDEDRRRFRDERERRQFGDVSQDRSGLSAHPDDHYRSWRERHMSELDRDYEEYCRECEQQFHRDFDNWRQNRGQRDNGTKATAADAGELELTHERALADDANTPSPIDAATLGTNNSANTIIGRGNKQR